ncbi:MAG: AbrB/MazE/SpoVT family DNA-binding domain-containing protein [Candidatus Bathyarchaeia archaeon]
MGIIYFGGLKLVEIVKVDEKGRVLIPKSIREKAKVKEGSYVKINANEKSITIEPLKPIADKYFGVFKIIRWPEDLDEFVVKVMREWWSQKPT